MVQALSGCYAKIERADKHITNLKDTTREHFNKNPLLYRHEYDEKLGTLSFYFTDQITLPPELPIIVGEILYQQRSALDHLVWQLFLHQSLVPPNKSGFPVFLTIDGYKSRSPAMIQGLNASALARIESFQPYCRGSAPDTDPLWLLHEMNNADKHRLLIVTRLFMGSSEYMGKFTPPIDLKKGANVLMMHKTPAERGKVFMRFETSTRESNLNINLSGEVMIKEAGMTQNEPVIPLLAQLSGYIRNIIKSFEPEFT